ncbi:MAG: beta strand repeat-containing protein, partial [Mycobacterium sp.]
MTFGNVTVTGNSVFSPGAGALLTLGAIAPSSGTRNLTFSGAGNTAVTGAITTGAGTLTKTGTGVLTLSGTNTNTGATTISAGTLRLGVNGALASTGTVTVSGTTANGTATWDLAGYNQTITTLNLGSTAGLANTVNTVATGAGTLTLGGNVAYTNSTSSANNPGTASITGKLSLGSGTRTFTIADSSNTATELSIGADISGTGGIIKAGTGVLEFTGTNNTYSGSTVISAGALRVSSLGNLPSTSNVQLNGGVLELAGSVALVPGTGAGQVQWTGSGGFSASGASRTVDFNGGSAVTWATTNFVGNGNSLILGSSGAGGTVTFPNDIDLNGAVRTVTMNGSNGALGGVLSNGGLTVAGTGALQLGSANTYTGITTITNITLVATKLSAGGAPSSIGASTSAAANLVLTNGALKYVGLGDTTDRGFQIGNGAGTTAYFDASGTTDATHDGAIVFSNTGAIAFGTTNQTRTVYLTGTNTAANTLAASITNNGSGVTNFYKDGAGTWVLSGANTYTGTTYIYSGILSVANSTALGTTAGNTTVPTGATLDFNNVSLGAEPLFVRGAGVGNAGALTMTGTSSYSGTLTLDGGDTTIGGSGSLDYSGWLKEIFSGTIVTKVGSGTLTLSGTQLVNSMEWVINGGTLVLAKTDSSVAAITGNTID